MVIVVKYLTFIMRADNHGEGGILALLALVPQRKEARRGAGLLAAARALRRRAALRRRRHHAGHLGAQRHRGPRGRRPPPPSPSSCRSPSSSSSRSSSCRRGARRGIGKVFGPVMLVWFAIIAVLGARQIVARARTCSSRSIRATRSASSSANGGHGFLVLGSVVLVHHRRRGALRRHGPLRRGPIRVGLVRGRLPGAAPQLLRPGRAPAHDPGRRRATRSTRSSRAGRSTRWSPSPPPPPSSPRRR